MKLLTAAPKGTQDILPSESHRWQYVEQVALAVASRFGFFEMRTPTFEHTELFVRSVGDTTDVVQKEMYTFNDKKDRSITLRPEGTAGVLRASIEQGLLSGQLPLKTSYVINCFRYEKPQAGRLREFHQFGVETMGSASPASDAEVIALASNLLSMLGVDKIKLFINSIGCKSCRPAYQKKLKDYFLSQQDSLCETCLGRLQTNPLRIIDCKSPSCKQITAQAPKMIDHLCPDCNDHFSELQKRLDAMSISYEIDPNIVRGLDYYVKTVFEFVTDAIGAQGTVCGGGRYDGLIEQLGGPAIPGIGFAMGIERLLLVMAASGSSFPDSPQADLYIAPIGTAASIMAGRLVHALRAEGVRAEYDTMDRSIKAQMRYADKLGARYTIVLGDNELKEQKITIKEMSSGVQTELELGERFVKDFSKILLDRQLNDIADAAKSL